MIPSKSQVTGKELNKTEKQKRGWNKQNISKIEIELRLETEYELNKIEKEK